MRVFTQQGRHAAPVRVTFGVTPRQISHLSVQGKGLGMGHCTKFGIWAYSLSEYDEIFTVCVQFYDDLMTLFRPVSLHVFKRYESFTSVGAFSQNSQRPKLKVASRNSCDLRKKVQTILSKVNLGLRTPPGGRSGKTFLRFYRQIIIRTSIKCPYFDYAWADFSLSQVRHASTSVKFGVEQPTVGSRQIPPSLVHGLASGCRNSAGRKR